MGDAGGPKKNLLEQSRELLASKSVVVAGDLIVDRNIIQLPIVPEHHHEPVQKTLFETRSGGAWFLREVIEVACPGLKPSAPAFLDPLPKDARVAEAFSLWAMKLRESGNDKDRVWRIEKFLGCRAPEGGTLIPVDGDLSAPDLLVLDDINLGFRDGKRKNPDGSIEAAEVWPLALRDGGNPTHVLLKTVAPLCESPLWNHLIKNPDRLTIVVSASALRSSRAIISQGLSWDQTIEDIVADLQSGLSRRDLGRCHRVVIQFGSEGAACFVRHPDRDEIQLERFLYIPAELEGHWLAKHEGTISGATSIFTAAVVRHILAPETYPLFIALGRGLSATRINHKVGGGNKETDKVSELQAKALEQTFYPTEPKPQVATPASAVTASTAQPVAPASAATAPAAPSTAPAGAAVSTSPPSAVATAKEEQKKFEDPADAYFCAFRRELLHDPKLRDRPATKSNLLEDLTGVGREYVFVMASEVVLRGVKALAAVPQAKYGDYFTVDRQEIERINAIRNLILAYKDNPTERRPLSIAVFGPPGSGKSFAIKQLAKELFGKGQTVREFNLSQFPRQPGALDEAFHLVRDASIRHEVPLVFWDEFDTGDLYWLGHFLAPMQDAEFRAGSVTHPFGKAIFVFAGGTSSSFEGFDRSALNDESFIAKKGPDFVSRLRGFVNIKGPNPTAELPMRLGRLSWAEQALRDPAFLIRRAILLRSTLERNASDLISPTGVAAISLDLVRAFLCVRRYLHGARSLEAVVTTSALARHRQFAASQLPPRHILQLHVSADFLDLVERAQIDAPAVEELAAECHAAWCGVRREKGWDWAEERNDAAKRHHLLRPYEQLTDDQKELYNRSTARRAQAKLDALHLAIARNINAPKRPLSDDEMNELASIEHDVWMRWRLLAGWECGSETDNKLRLHPDIAAFGLVQSEEQEIDHRIVASIPAALEKRGYMLVDQLRIGVVGHRTLAETDKIEAAARKALQQIRDLLPAIPLIILSALAEGADRLVVREALKHKDVRFVAVLPLPHQEYLKDFRKRKSRDEFEELLDQADEVSEPEPAEPRASAYAANGDRLVNECDLLIAVWDGADNETGRVVKQAHGKHVMHILAGNTDQQTRKPTTLGERQGDLTTLAPEK